MSNVRIRINNEELASPNPTTARALYELGALGKDRQLFRETRDGKDARVHRDDAEIHLKENEKFYDDAEIHLKENEKFYSEKVVTIVVEGKRRHE